MNPLPSQPSGGSSTTVVVGGGSGGGSGGVGGVGYHTHPAAAIDGGTLEDDLLPERLQAIGPDAEDADLQTDNGWWAAGAFAANMPDSSTWVVQTILSRNAVGPFGTQIAHESVGSRRVFRRTLAVFWTAWEEITPFGWVKPIVKACATGNVTLTAPGATIDGVTMASGDRFLAPLQTTAADRGIYIWNGASSTATRALDANTASDLAAAEVGVQQGTSYGGSRWSTSFKSTDTLGTTAMTWGRVNDDTTAVVFRGRIAPNTAVTGAATIPWTEDTDTHTAHSGGTFTVPTGLGGLYQINLAWKPAGATAVAMNVKKNGTTVLVTPGSTATAFTGLAASFILDLAAADALTIEASGGFTTTNDTAYNTWCHVARLRS